MHSVQRAVLSLLFISGVACLPDLALSAGASGVQPSAGVVQQTSPLTATPRMGMTWELVSHDASLGVDMVGCLGCEPYVGDTSCREALPILCLNQNGSVNPGLPTDYYHGWAAGKIGLTSPVRGFALRSLTIANAICEKQLGAGYQMAEFHDGNGGWNWSAYGNISGESRFWTHINDQPTGNCFDLE